MKHSTLLRQISARTSGHPRNEQTSWIETTKAEILEIFRLRSAQSNGFVDFILLGSFTMLSSKHSHLFRICHRSLSSLTAKHSTSAHLKYLQLLNVWCFAALISTEPWAVQITSQGKLPFIICRFPGSICQLGIPMYVLYVYVHLYTYVYTYMNMHQTSLGVMSL